MANKWLTENLEENEILDLNGFGLAKESFGMPCEMEIQRLK